MSDYIIAKNKEFLDGLKPGYVLSLKRDKIATEAGNIDGEMCCLYENGTMIYLGWYDRLIFERSMNVVVVLHKQQKWDLIFDYQGDIISNCLRML